MAWRKWMLIGPVLAMLGAAGLVLKHVPMFSIPWMFEVIALAFVAGVFFFAKRKGTLYSEFFACVILLFFMNTAWMSYIYRHP